MMGKADMHPAAPLLLTPDEIRDLTGYTQQARQLEELRRQGFYRARRQAALDYLARALPDAWGVGQFREALTMPGETAISQMARGSLNAIERQRATLQPPPPDTP